jgi:hypothetical protein
MRRTPFCRHTARFVEANQIRWVHFGDLVTSRRKHFGSDTRSISQNPNPFSLFSEIPLTNPYKMGEFFRLGILGKSCLCKSLSLLGPPFPQTGNNSYQSPILGPKRDSAHGSKRLFMPSNSRPRLAAELSTSHNDRRCQKKWGEMPSSVGHFVQLTFLRLPPHDSTTTAVATNRMGRSGF